MNYKLWTSSRSYCTNKNKTEDHIRYQAVRPINKMFVFSVCRPYLVFCHSLKDFSNVWSHFSYYIRHKNSCQSSNLTKTNKRDEEQEEIGNTGNFFLCWTKWLPSHSELIRFIHVKINIHSDTKLYKVVWKIFRYDIKLYDYNGNHVLVIV